MNESQVNAVTDSESVKHSKNAAASLSRAESIADRQLQDDTREIDLAQIFSALRQKILWIVIFAVAGAVLAFGYTKIFCAKQYKAKSTIYLVSASNSVLNLSDLQIGSGIADDYAAMIKSRSVLLTVADNLELDYTYQQMSDLITTENQTNTHILAIYATCTDAELAKKIANETAKVSIRKISEVMEISAPNIIDDAIVPSAPASPNVSKNTLIGLLVGALGVIAVVVIRCVMDRTVKSTEDLERYCGLVTLTKVSDMNHSQKYGYKHYGYSYEHKDQPQNAKQKDTVQKGGRRS